MPLAGCSLSLWILLPAVLLLKAVRATQTTSPPPNNPLSRRHPTVDSPFPGPQRPGCGLWMSATSWLSARGFAGDWLVVEVQYQGLSVSSSFHFPLALSAGWAASQWHKHTLTDSLWPENERITLRIGIFMGVPMNRRLFQTFKCSGVVLLNKPQKL